MATILLLFISALVLTGTVQCAKNDDKQVEEEKEACCREFPKGLIFNDSEALGTWHMRHFKDEKSEGPGDLRCVEYTLLTDQDRKNLSDVVGKFVPDLNWEKLVLRLHIPCLSANKTRPCSYYLERLEGDGTYRVLQIAPPGSSGKLTQANVSRYPLFLKIEEGVYLVMMYCWEDSLFLYGRQPAGGQVDNRLKKIIGTYWPGEQ